MSASALSNRIWRRGMKMTRTKQQTTILKIGMNPNQREKASARTSRCGFSDSASALRRHCGYREVGSGRPRPMARPRSWNFQCPVAPRASLVAQASERPKSQTHLHIKVGLRTLRHLPCTDSRESVNERPNTFCAPYRCCADSGWLESRKYCPVVSCDESVPQ